MVALFVGNVGIKPLTTPLMRWCGIKVVMLGALVGRGLLLALAGVQPSTPIPALVVLLVLSGIFRSIGFTTYNTVAFVDVQPGRMTSANTLMSTVQELGAGLGVAVGALLVRVGEPVAAKTVRWHRGAVPVRLRRSRADSRRAARGGDASSPNCGQRGHRPHLKEGPHDGQSYDGGLPGSGELGARGPQHRGVAGSRAPARAATFIATPRRSSWGTAIPTPRSCSSASSLAPRGPPVRAVCRPRRATARPGVRAGRHRPLLDVHDKCREALQVQDDGQAAHPCHPARWQVASCQPWLLAELDAVAPRVVVLLGATAGQAVYGTDFRVTAARGRPLEPPTFLDGLDAPTFVATVHPSSVLRSRQRDTDLDAFVRDLTVAAAALAQ